MKQYLLALLFAMQTCLPAFGSTETKIPGTYAPGLQATKNFIKNPDCQNLFYVTSSATPAGLTSNTSTPLVTGAGTQCRWNPGASGKTLKFDIDTLSPNVANGNCRASFYTGTLTAGDYAAYLEYDSVQVTTSLALTSSVNGQEFNIDYPCSSSATTRKLVVTSLTTPSAMTIGGVSFGKNLNIGNVAQAKVAVSLSSNASLALAHTNDVKLTFGSTLTTNKLEGFSLSSGTLTATTAGEGYVTCSWEQTAVSDSATIRHVRANIRKNGTEIRPGGFVGGVASNAIEGKNPTASASSYVSWAVGDTIECYAYQSNANGTSYSTAKQYVEVLSFPTTSQQAISNNTTPAFWSGNYNSTCVWTNVNTSYNDFQNDATCTLVQKQSSNISCVASGGVLPQVTCTLPKLGTYEVCAAFPSYGSVSTDTGQRLMGTSQALPISESGHTATGGSPMQINLCGLYTATTLSPVFNVQGYTASGTLTIGNVGNSAMDWTIKDISQSGTMPVLTSNTLRNEIRLSSVNGYGSTNTKVRKWTTIDLNTGSAMTLAQSATLGDSITINEAGVYCVSYTDNFSAGQQFAVSKSDTSDASSLSGLARFAYNYADAAVPNNVSGCGYLAAGDIIRANTQGTAVDTASRSQFSIVKTY